MNGFSAEPGERGAQRHVDRAVARGVGVIGGADAGADLAAARCRCTTMATESFGPSRSALLLGEASPASACRRASIDSVICLAPFCRRRPPPPPHAAASARKLAARRAGSARCSAASASSRVDDAARERAFAAHARAPRARRRDVCPAGAPPAIAATPPATRLRAIVSSPRLLAEIGERGRAHALEIAAERRQRQIAVEHAVLADRALDLPGARHLPELGGRASARAARSGARPAWSASRRRRRCGRGSPPCHAARAIAQRSRRRHAGESARPHRRSASRDSADRPASCVTGSRQRPFGHRERPQQPAVAIDHHRRARARAHRDRAGRAISDRRSTPAGRRATARRRARRRRRTGGVRASEETRRRAGPRPSAGRGGRAAHVRARPSLPPLRGGGREREAVATRLISPSPRSRRTPCGRSARADTCPPPSPRG